MNYLYKIYAVGPSGRPVFHFQSDADYNSKEEARDEGQQYVWNNYTSHQRRVSTFIVVPLPEIPHKVGNYN